MNSPAHRRRERQVYTVSRLMQDVQQQLESGFGTLWLQGELSNVARPGSGHLYFSLKDSRSQIRCAMFKGRNRLMDFEPAAGDAVVVRGKLGLYAARGDFQLIVEHMEPAGAGRLQAAFEALKRELDALGWFAMEAKRALPSAPDTIGVVTSPTGAALRDVLQVLNRRYPQGRVVLYPTMTQGQQAAADVVRALERASRRREVDVLLLVRGGGSLEDLQAFNDRRVAAAIRATTLPLVCGVGHEVDITIADLVADVRAPTPSAAAELAVPDGRALRERAVRAHESLLGVLRRRLEAQRREQDLLDRRLANRHPERLLLERARHVDDLHERLLLRASALRRDAGQDARRLDERLLAHHPRRVVASARERHDTLQRRLEAAMKHRLSKRSDATQRLGRRLEARSPAVALSGATARHARASTALRRAMQQQLQQRDAALSPLATTLAAIGPQAVLARGYAFLQSGRRVLAGTQGITSGMRITARLSDGSLEATVDTVHTDRSPADQAFVPDSTTR